MAEGRYLFAKFAGSIAGVLLCSLNLHAQAVGTVRGRVADTGTNQPLANVSIVVEGTRFGTTTRLDGTFDLGGVPAGRVSLGARRIGYHSTSTLVTVAAGAVASVDIKLLPQAAVLTEMVVTGYGSQRREAVTGAVSTVEAKDAKVGVVTNATQMLQGRAPGVQIVQSNGEPGGNTQIRIRGGTSISAGNEPLYVIDGVPLQNDGTSPGAAGVAFNAALSRNPLNSISPDDIESMTILKDASATAIYGSRAANGVILITTKRGTRDSQLEYDVYAGAASPTKTLGLATADQYRTFVTQFKDSLGGQGAVTALGNASTDWEKALTRTSLAMNHNLAFSGGSAQTKYRASMNYFDQEGIIKNSGLKRYQGRLNATHDALDSRLRLALNLSASRVNNTFSPNENGGGFTGGLFTNMVIFDPTKPIQNADGTFFEIGTGAQDVRNPVAMIQQLYDYAPENRLLGNVTGTIQLHDNLTAQTLLGADNSNSTRQSYAPRVSPIGAAFSGYARQAERSLQNLNFQQLLTFSKHMGENEVELVGGYEYTKNNNMEFASAAQGFITDAYGVDNLNAGTTTPVGYPYSWHSESELSSFFSRLNIGFGGRFFVTGVMRRDGSSRLAPGHQWAVFPGLSASWRMTDESFMRSHPLGLSALALRVGWGKQGNQAVAPYQTQLLLKSDNGSLYPFGGVVTSGLRAVQVGNPDLKWETAEQTNVGIDFGLLQDRVTGTIDIYQKNTKDLLLNRAVPQPAVVSSRIENIGSLRNRGVEGSLDMQLWSSGKKSLTGGLVLTVERNQVTSLGDTTAACAADSTTQSFRAASNAKCTFIQSGFVFGQGQSNQYSQIILRGQPLGSFLAPRFIGVKNGQQYFACTVAGPSCANGQTTDPTDADREFIGSANPSFTLGVRNNAAWGALDMAWLWRGEFGGNTFNNTALVYQTKSDAAQGRNFIAAAIGMPDNIHEPAKFSSRWIESRTFVRLQNMTLGYTLPQSLTRGRTTRAYASGDNLLLFTGYSGYDPEVFVASGLASRGIDYLTYPPTRRFTIGARTQF